MPYNFYRKIAAEKKKGKIVHHHTLKLLKMSKDQHLSFDFVLLNVRISRFSFPHCMLESR